MTEDDPSSELYPSPLVKKSTPNEHQNGLSALSTKQVNFLTFVFLVAQWPLLNRHAREAPSEMKPGNGDKTS